MFRSSDNGLSWNPLLGPGSDTLYVEGVAVNSTDLYCLGSFTYHSSDSGATWSVSLKPVGDQYFASAIQGSNLFAATEFGVYKTTDNGNAWSQINSGLEHVSGINTFLVNGARVYAATEAGIYKTTNEGDIWTELNSDWHKTSVRSLAINAADLFAGTMGGGVYLSTNDGQGWKAVNSGLENKEILSLMLDGANLYAATSGGVFRTTNRGTSWNFISAGLPEQRVTDVTIVGSHLFVVTQNNGVYTSSDNGNSWDQVSPLVNSPAFLWGFAETPSALLAHYDGGIFRSTDNAASWAPGSGLGNSYVYDLAANGTTVFAGTRGGVHRSTDEGLTWTECNSSWRKTVVEAVAVCRGDVFAGTGGGVYRSTDNGASWKRANTGLEGTVVRTMATDGNSLFASIVPSGVFVTTNNGTSWHRVKSDTADRWFDDGTPDYSAYCLGAAEGHLFAGGARIFVSSHDGSNWTPFIPRMPPLQYGTVSSFTTSGNNVFASTTQGAVGGVLLSTDQGTSWTDVGNGTDGVEAIAAHGAYLFAQTSNAGLWRRPLSEMAPPSSHSKQETPSDFFLEGNFPNPFNPSTTIRFVLPSRSTVRIDIYDMLGQRVATLVNSEFDTGVHQVVWNASVSSGLYFCRMEGFSVSDPTKTFVAVRKMALLK